jgi:hypothetical protein
MLAKGLPANNLLVPAWIFRGQQHSTSPSYSAASPNDLVRDWDRGRLG